MVYPIKCPYDDLQFSSFGVKIRDATIFPNYITMLVRVENEEPKVSKVGAENDEIYMMQYKKVVAASAREPRKFSVEAFCLLQQSHIFNMADKKVHLLVGKVTADDDGGNMIVVAENSSSSIQTSNERPLKWRENRSSALPTQKQRNVQRLSWFARHLQKSRQASGTRNEATDP